MTPTGRAFTLALSLLLAASACAGEPDGEGGGGEPEPTPAADSTAFPWDGDGGKEDVFGRSLVGVPRPFEPDPELLAEPLEQEVALRTNMRLRREQAWETARHVLEPVPLLGLASQINRLPDCPEGVETRDIDRCARQRDEASCTNYTSGGVAICAWDAEAQACAPTCDNLTLPEGQAIPTIPRWSTWYGVDDINTIFKSAYGGLTPEEQRARRRFTDAEIGQAFLRNNRAIDRSRRWPLRRYTDAVGELFGCPLEQGAEETNEEYALRCARARQSQFSGGSGGLARMTYSPAMVLHMMRNYPEILACRDDQLTETWCGGDVPCVEPQDNFSTCFRSEFPADAGNPWAELDPAEVGEVVGLPDVGGTVLIKATWSRVGFGFELPVYDTDAEALTELLGEGSLALWPEGGDRSYGPPEDGQPLDQAYPTPQDIYTITTSSGATYRLTGLHIMTKELRHWNWISLWWSDEPDADFGADRPDSFAELPSAWSNYKMCVVVDYLESDEEAAARFDELPSLRAAIEATGAGANTPSWCSNPYIEDGPGNARTNCIGCHQHAGSRFDEQGQELALPAIITEPGTELDATNRYPANGRTRRRTHFATDYSWAFSRMDDLTELMRTEIEYQGSRDEDWRRQRDILGLEGDAAAGQALYAETTSEQACADCHGAQGEGDFGPALEQVFSGKTKWQLMHTVLHGRGQMPAWGEVLSDQELADLFAYLDQTFAPRR